MIYIKQPSCPTLSVKSSVYSTEDVTVIFHRGKAPVDDDTSDTSRPSKRRTILIGAFHIILTIVLGILVTIGILTVFVKVLEHKYEEPRSAAASETLQMTEYDAGNLASEDPVRWCHNICDGN